MGLFDNLFLDQNTAVTINDGIDHSKDVVTEIIAPSTPGTSDAISSSQASIPQGDATLDGLFDVDTAEEKAAQVTLNPEPPKDIALEIGHGSTPTSSTDTALSFDIGGDISFDIGGDMTTGSFQSDDALVSEGVSLAEVGISGEVSPGLGDASSTQSVGDIPLLGVSGDGEVALVDTPSVISTPTDNALFSLLNEEPVDAQNIGEITVTEASSVEESPTDIQNSGIFSGILGVQSEESPIETTSSLESDSTDILLINAPIEAEVEASLKSSENTERISATLSQMGPQMSALTTLTGSPKLKEKLSKFINELESLELEDQSEKDHKRQQIEMYRTRIREIKAEYDMRIRALELEESELEKQIREMDDEKERIRNVLTTFQKELKVSETL